MAGLEKGRKVPLAELKKQERNPHYSLVAMRRKNRLKLHQNLRKVGYFIDEIFIVIQLEVSMAATSAWLSYTQRTSWLLCCLRHWYIFRDFFTGEISDSGSGSDSDEEFQDGYDENLIGDEEDRKMLEQMTEKEREQVLYNRMEQREILRTR